MNSFDTPVDDSTLCGGGADLVVEAAAGQLARQSADPATAGRLMVPDRQLGEVARHVPVESALAVSVINSGGAGGLLGLTRRGLTGLRIESAESALRDLDDLAGNAARVVAAADELDPEIEVFVELPFAPRWQAAVEVVEAAGRSAKVIAGTDGVRLAEQLSILIEADCGFKVQLGDDPRSADRWQLALAVDALVEGSSVADAAGLLAGGDHGRTWEHVQNWDDATRQRVRRRLSRVAENQTARGGVRPADSRGRTGA
jgi:hypothetical protein